MNECLCRDNGRFVAGQRYGRRTEFRSGQQAHNKLPVGSVRIRLDHGVYRAFVKVAEPNKWRYRALIVWEEANGPIPRGHIIHHIDRNTLNDDLSNLQCMSRAEHVREHIGELHEMRLIKCGY